MSRKGRETHSQILDGALALASTVGLEGLSIGSVAKAAGLSKSGLFAHFESKEDLQLQVLETAVDRWMRRVMMPALRQPRGEPRIRAMFENWLTWAESGHRGGCPFIAASAELDDRPGPLRDYLASTQRDALAGLATAAGIAVAEGHFHDQLDVEQFAHEFYSIVLGYHHFHRLLDDPRAAERARVSFDHLLARCRDRAKP